MTSDTVILRKCTDLFMIAHYFVVLFEFTEIIVTIWW